MRKLVLIITLFVLFITNTALSKERDYYYSDIETGFKIAALSQFRSPPVPITEMGITVQVISPIGSYGRQANTPLDKNMFYTNGWDFVGIRGLSMIITNDTEKVITVNWRNSAIYVNDINYGIPSFENMPNIDVGNPSATPNTIIPPKQHVVVEPVTSTIEQAERSRWRNPIPLPRNPELSLFFSYYICVVANNNPFYITVKAPGIYLPPISETMPEKAK